jgi:hypothetical protein
LLTDPVIAARLRDLFAHVPDYDLGDLHLLKTGRHFRLHPGLKIILGRNQSENELIQGMAGAGLPLYRPVDFRGPTCLALGNLNSGADRIIGGIMAGYSQEKKTRYRVQKQVVGGNESVVSMDGRFSKEQAAAFRIG